MSDDTTFATHPTQQPLSMADAKDQRIRDLEREVERLNSELLKGLKFVSELSRSHEADRAKEGE